MKHRLFSAYWSLLLGGILSASVLYGGDSVGHAYPFVLYCKGVEPGQLDVKLFAYEDLQPMYAEIYRMSPFYRHATFRTLKTRRLAEDWLQYEGENPYSEFFVLAVPPAGESEELGHLKTSILMRDAYQQITCGSWKRGVSATSFY